jgi:1-acyl-sn-glycerol-3-phosphate acyltransferase
MSAALLLRSAAYAAVQAVATPIYTLVAILTFPLPLRTRYRIITSWSRLMVWAAEHICGIRYRVLGRSNVPRTPCVILSNHQSAWETLAFQVIFPPQVWVVKRELLWVPFFGWGLAMLKPIAIDRGSGTGALRQMLEQGRDRLARGFSIVVFPQGTRAPPGTRGTYHPGGAWLAKQTGACIVPVAHNAGRCWPRQALLKRPGLITVSIGRAIDAAGREPAELMREVAEWIGNELDRIDAHESK